MKNQNRNDRRGALTALLSLALVCMLGLYGITVMGAGDRRSAYAESVALSGDPSPAIYVTEKNANSVVGVLTLAQEWNRSRGEIEQTNISQGSGVVIADGGYVLTNYHVVEGGSAYQVLMPSGEKVDAVLAGSDSSTDLAVLKVEGDAANQLVPVTVGSVDSLQIGSTVVAIGNPGGEVLANTVTQGVVSALERTSVNSNANNTTRRINYIQHDAAINNGNSGGGLFNYRGELVGINTLKYAGSAYSSVTFEGLGFAIPIDTAYEIATQLIENGRVIRPGLGITAIDFTDGPSEPLPNAAPQSVCVNSVNPGGAAEAAGLKQYDFIYAVDGERVTSMFDLTGILDQHKAGDTVKVTVIRYAQAGYYQTAGNNIFGYGFGYNFGNGGSNELVVSGGYDKIDLDVTLEELDAD